MRRLLMCFALLLLLVALAGCGNKGPLVVPDSAPVTASTVTPTAATSVD